MLLAPVVAEIDGVDIVFQGLAHLGDVVIGDAGEQVMDELRVVDQIDQEVLHRAQGPGAFEQGEAEIRTAGNDPGKRSMRALDVGEKARVAGVGEDQAVQVARAL